VCSHAQRQLIQILHCSKVEFREGVKALGPIKDLEAKTFTDRQIDDLFDHVYDGGGKRTERMLRLEDFIRVFDHERQQKTKRRDGGKSEHKDGQGKTVRTHTFTEIMLECKDGTRGTEQNLVVKASIKWEDLLHLLQRTFKRPVTFMYEDVGHHQHTVKNASDLAKCWDGLALSGRGDEASRHLECFILDFDAVTAKAASEDKRAGGRPSLQERRQRAIKVHGVVEAGDVRDPVESLDFRSRNRWIDDMMKLLGAPLENEPPDMVGRWDVLVKECQALDANDNGSVTIEGFRNALTRTQPRMTLEKVEWFIEDADKDVNGNVSYKTYADTKKQGQSSGQAVSAQVSPLAYCYDAAAFAIWLPASPAARAPPVPVYECPPCPSLRARGSRAPQAASIGGEG
jgi:hypothetical protein